ncbi:MAG: Lrp/AsnC family transcriptional regulator [Lachnospiraceae bacterium]|nr:Lrp/AsnC family transcriptional regulator [Lachnospiraceae bacterium]
MDGIDEKILDLMKGNARITYQELGDILGMSRVAAKKRVTKLEKAGIIRGYNTTIYNGDITLLIDIQTAPGKYEDVLKYVSTRTAYVRQIYRTTGEDHIHMVAVSDSVKDLKYLEKMIMKKCGDDIVHMTSHAVTEIIKDVYGGITYESRRKALQTDQEDR